MSTPTDDLAQLARRYLGEIRNDVLIRLPDGRAFGHGDGYMPLLVQFTREDRAARGLRRMTDPSDRPPPEHLSALEAIRQADATLVTAPPGWGKSTFARHIALNLAGARLGDPDFGDTRLTAAVPRHDHGAPEAQESTSTPLWPLLVEASGPSGFRNLVATAWPTFDRWRAEAGRSPLLVLVDQAERLGGGASAFLAEACDEAASDLRVVVLADHAAAERWSVPPAMTRHRLLPFNEAQRRALAVITTGHVAPELPTDGAPAGFFAAALSLAPGPRVTDAEDLADRWLAANAPGSADAAMDAALIAARDGAWPVETSIRIPRHLGELIAARRLAGREPVETARAFAHAPERMGAVVAAVFRRRENDPAGRDALAEALAALPGDIGRRGALVAAAHAAALSGPIRQRLREALATIVTKGRLAPSERIRAGAHLSELGDPRDLEALVPVAGGTFRMGSDAHPNSQPAFDATVGDFRIGRYPVVNALYAAFVAATGRVWPSADGKERANAPATELSWHDARAFCFWLTGRWRDAGRIAADEIVRLPTEPEWERAARGDITGPGPIYPWGPDWRDDCANAEPVGHNATCAVGLFPAGASPWGALDMAGQVWEWTSTLWGAEMEAPSFRYPYQANDGREADEAPPGVRRILRGGCFTGGSAKANCTYRGSLEPTGRWRGNGFRVVVVRKTS